VSVTDLTAQSPLAAHSERNPLVTLRWITEGRSARSQALLQRFAFNLRQKASPFAFKSLI